MCSFFEAFWPEVVATLVGVIAGVPAALWLNRKWLAHKDAREHAKSQERLREALKGLAAAATENLELLTYARDAMTGGRVITGLSLNNSTWAVLRPVVMVDLPNLPLRLWLARFFEEHGSLGRAVAEPLRTSWPIWRASRYRR